MTERRPPGFQPLDPAAAKKLAMRRFTWCRIHHSLLDDTRWRLVARMARAPQHVVEGFVLRLEIFASANRPRGSIEGFSIPALAAHWGLTSDDVLARIYAALEHPEIGWLDQDTIATFYERNPDVEDATAAARQQRLRDRRKAAREAAKVEREARGSGYPPSRVTHRDAVTITPDQIKVLDTGEKTGDKLSQVEAAELWLATEGKRLLAEHQVANPETAIERWRRDLDNDAEALATIIKAAAATGYVAGRFHNLIVDQIKRHPVKGTTLPLPLGPMGVTKRRTENGG